ncbi:UDP-glycosyltransferase 79A6-like [Nymphaea colorata]|nr:UDP-glycosyltransferase 79A6-like [Nymphaea colorata]
MGSLAMEGDNHNQPLQVVMFPFLAFGHIFPFVHLSNALAANGVNVTVLTLPSLVPKIRLSLDPNIPILSNKLPPIDGLPSDVYSTKCTWHALQRPHLRLSRLVSCMSRSDAIAVRSTYEVEAPSINYLSSQCRKPVLPTGVLLPKAPAGDLEPKLAKWLNKFPKGTVVFCSFGSESSLSVKQMKELVAGLEMTGFPFLAVLNTAADAPKAKKQELEAEIGEKAGGRGMVSSGWVNQPLILRHPAVGCSINHGGWSSIVEAAEAGCQLVMLPVKGDQYPNTKLMVMQLRAAVKINRRAWDGWFTRKAVRTVMVEGSKKGKVVSVRNQNEEIIKGT